MKRQLGSLVLGLGLGALVTFSLRSFSRPDASGGAAEPPPRYADPSAAPWTPPSLLKEADAAARVDAWLGTEIVDLAALRALLPVLPAGEFSRLAQALLGRRGGEAREAFQAVFDVWVERDAATAARWAGALPENAPLNGKARRLLREQAGLVWARSDLDAALVWAHALPDAGGEWGAAARIYGQLAEHDPQRALALVRARGDEAFLKKAIERIYDGWALRDPAGAVQGLGAERIRNGSPLYMLSGEIGRWAEKNPDAAMAWALAQTNERPDLFSMAGILSRRPDPRPVADALVRASDGVASADLLGHLAQSWVVENPEAAVAWIKSIGDRDLRAAVIEQSARSYNSAKPWASIDLVVLLPDGEQRDSILQSRLAAWANSDPEAALAWAEKNDEPVAMKAVQVSAVATLASQDRAAALAVLREISDAKTRRAATGALAGAWAQTDPAAAADWFAAEAAGTRTVYDTREWRPVVEPWFEKDPVAARDWINRLPDETQREQAAQWWTMELINSPLSLAARAELVVGVADTWRQKENLRLISMDWFKVDAAAARAWIEASSLPQETKDSVLREFGGAAGAR